MKLAGKIGLCDPMSSDDEFEKIDFLLCTCIMLKVISSERGSQANSIGLK